MKEERWRSGGAAGLAPSKGWRNSGGGKQKYRVKSLDRTLDILEFISRSGQEGVSVSEVARENQTTKSNAFGILQTLVDRGYLSDSGEGMTRRYRLGPMFLQLASAASAQRPISQLAQATLAEVSRESGLPSRFGVLDGGYAVALYKQDAPGPIQFAPYLGRRELLHCSGMGKALLSVLSEDQVRSIASTTGLPRRTENTITDVDELLVRLGEARELGYAFDEEEDNLGVFCVGSPVISADGQAVGAISVSGLKQGRSQEDLHEIGRLLKDQTQSLSRQMGA